ncbi:MAG: hypothetical protein WBB45_21025 [Cyclobacteriaceae bacterium]
MFGNSSIAFSAGYQVPPGHSSALPGIQTRYLYSLVAVSDQAILHSLEHRHLQAWPRCRVPYLLTAAIAESLAMCPYLSYYQGPSVEVGISTKTLMYHDRRLLGAFIRLIALYLYRHTLKEGRIRISNQVYRGRAEVVFGGRDTYLQAGSLMPDTALSVMVDATDIAHIQDFLHTRTMGYLHIDDSDTGIVSIKLVLPDC